MLKAALLRLRVPSRGPQALCHVASKKRLAFRAWFALLHVDLIVAVRGFRGLRGWLEGQRVPLSADPRQSVENVLEALSCAIAFGFHEYLCLKYSAVAVHLLRAHGHSVRLVIGVKQCPFESHAWIEGDGWSAGEVGARSDWAIVQRL